MEKDIMIKKIIALILIIIVILEIRHIIKDISNTENLLGELNHYINTVEIENEKLNNKIEELSTEEDSEKKLPYVPKNFKVIEDDETKGFVIEDLSGNQFVWVPCSISGKDGNVKMNRYNFDVEDSLNIEECLENKKEINDFLESVSENHGFYIARFEAGKENEKLVFKKNKEVYTQITKEQAISLIEEFEYADVEMSLVNSFAWDTCLKWIDTTEEGYSVSCNAKNKFSLSETGKESVKNIYDLNYNAWEMTTEEYDGFIVYRGGLNLYDSFSCGYRGSILNIPSVSLSFRTILYK